MGILYDDLAIVLIHFFNVLLEKKKMIKKHEYGYLNGRDKD